MLNFRSHRIAVFACSLTIALLVTGLHSEDQDLPKLNRMVLKFAEVHLGKQVGDGECWTLAAEALADAGAQQPGIDDIPVYEFGDKLKAGETIFPGDVVQFEKVKFIRKTKKGTIEQTMPQHTAIVAKVEEKKITLLHQNFAGKLTVETATIHLDDRKEGTIEFYRPKLKK
ncbi:MAG: hypothetical protein JWM11_7406 [Planctomycetaceae bacterium]|nr:hypothetical protein [Planctomycetaceae bacterium]